MKGEDLVFLVMFGLVTLGLFYHIHTFAVTVAMEVVKLVIGG